MAAQFTLLAAAWGTSFLFIKIGLRGLSPAQVVWARMVFGAAALGILVVLQRRPVPRDPHLWGHLTVVAVLLCLAPFLLFAWAEQHISSGMASILNATTPLLAMLIAAMALPEEKFTRPKTLGLLLGFVGVVTIISAWQGLDVRHDALARLACLGATACYGLAFVYLRRFVAHRGIPAVSQAFIQVFAGAVLMLIATPWIAATPIHLDAGVVASMVFLGAAGTGMAYVWNNNVVNAWGATNAASVTYLTPIAGVALGVLVLGEPLHWNQPVGAVLVVLGILAAHGRLGRRRPRYSSERSQSETVTSSPTESFPGRTTANLAPNATPPSAARR